ncbi:MAG TPA: anthranilate synthase component I family protein [Polyangiaceae bacterium]|nr:anthranilate synthase component I family protein [Polyangiaceae bacterium]
MHVLTIDAAPDAWAVARALAERPGLAFVLGDGGRTAYVACDPSASTRALDPEPGHACAARPFGEIPRWIGLLPYEARRTLERSRAAEGRTPPEVEDPLWYRYECVVKITSRIEVIGSEARAANELASRLRRALRTRARPVERPHVELRARPEPGEAHAARIRRALELIRQGEIYQVNLARKFELAVNGRALEVLAALGAGGLPPHALAVEWPELGVAMASPELFLALEPGGLVRTRPIKGTRPRALDAEADAVLARELDADPKERAELAMVIDVERNDLGRLARAGSVRLAEPPRVETHARVHHRAATVAATLREGVTREELLLAMLPSGSVTGAPKIRAMEVIAALEPARRGLYTGAAGFLREDGGLELGMVIRTVTLRDGQGSYYAGGGIVADSDPEREVRETLWKAAALIELVGGTLDAWS